MRIRPKTRADRFCFIVFPLMILGILLLLSPLPAQSGPIPPLPQDNPDALRQQLMKHREQEASLKARLAKALMETERAMTLNQEHYNALYYNLELNLNPSTNILTGLVTVRAEVTGSSLVALDLDLRNNMSVSSVTAGGVATTFTHSNHLLTADLDRTYATGETVEVTVTYSGNPESSYWGWDSYGGQHMIWTLSEPYGARHWWPCKDLNSDKPDSVDIEVTVPDNLYVASNGVLISDVDHGTTRTFHWKTAYPIATYLVSLAIHPYTFYNDWYTPLSGGDPMEVQFYVFPAHYDDVQETYALTVPMIGIFAAGFGEYPFVTEKYGHAEFTWGGGMEHQTITSMGGWSEDLISHELAHQWWGDMVTCATFHHIWLNEGFATWSEAYWKEQTEGFGVYQDYMDAAAYYGAGTIYVEDPSDFSSIFSTNLSYNKASWVVHMLRGVLDDANFFTGLENYRTLYEYSSATTEQFRDAMEQVSGVDLDVFFSQWIYGQYFPIYEYGWDVSRDETVDLVINQVQTNTGLYDMPIDVRITTTTGTFDFTVQNRLATQSYRLSVSGEVESVVLDPDDWILCQILTTVSNPTFDQGILLVNGVHWDTYDDEIISAYEDSVFSGSFPISFWDTFNEPVGGYPNSLPEPIGHGPVPGEIIGQYSTVIWVGNHYQGDLADWQESPILSYLETGGNVLLLTRRSQSFLSGALSDYLGINWAETQISLSNCLAVYTGLIDMSYTGDQSWNDVYWPTVGPESTLLFKTTGGFSGDRGLGVWAHPAAGGTHRLDGAQFVHIGGRPYRTDHAALRINVEYILAELLGEPYNPSTDLPTQTLITRPVLLPNHPNPFNPQTAIPFALPTSDQVELAIYDTTGRLVRSLIADVRPAGRQTVRWDGTDNHGRAVASGTYFARLVASDYTAVRSLVLVR